MVNFPGTVGGLYRVSGLSIGTGGLLLRHLFPLIIFEVFHPRGPVLWPDAAGSCPEAGTVVSVIVSFPVSVPL